MAARESLAPAIDTERLALRGHRVEDLDECAALWGDAAVTRYIGGRPFAREEVWQRLLRHVGHWELVGFGYWVVRETRSGRFVGEVGFADLKRDLAPAFGDAPEVGWVLTPGAQGQGFATEAVRASLEWGQAVWGRRRVVCMIDVANAPSLRVAAKLDFREYARAEYHGTPTILFERGP